MNERMIKEILRTEKTGTSKQALKPSEGIYYVIPRKKGNPIVVSRRSDDESKTEEELLHIFFWHDVLKSIAHEYKLSQDEVDDLKDHYMAVPRGRVQKEFDPHSQSYTGNYIVFHGGEIPTSLISNFVYQDFGLAPLVPVKKVRWQEESHEKVTPKDKEVFDKIITKKKKK